MSGRIRTIKPEMLADAVVAGLSDAAFRLFIAMIVMADDYGNLPAHPRQVEGQVFWSEESPSRGSRENVASLLEELARSALVQLYRVRGQPYAHLRGWAKHQKVDHPGKPRVPRPDDAETLSGPELARGVVAPVARASREPRETVAPDRYPDHDREGILAHTRASGDPEPVVVRLPTVERPNEADADAVLDTLLRASDGAVDIRGPAQTTAAFAAAVREAGYALTELAALGRYVAAGECAWARRKRFDLSFFLTTDRHGVPRLSELVTKAAEWDRGRAVARGGPAFPAQSAIPYYRPEAEPVSDLAAVRTGVRELARAVGRGARGDG